MATKKTTTSSSKTPSKSKPKSAKSKADAVKAKQRAEAELLIKRKRFMRSIIFFALTILVFCIYALPDNNKNLWSALHTCYWGFFGFCGIFIPFILLYCGVQYAKDKPSYRFQLRVFFFILLFLLFSTIVYAFGVSEKELSSYGTEINNCFINGRDYNGAGLFGGLFGIIFINLFGSTGTIIICIILFIIVGMISLDSLIINVFNIFKKPVRNVSNRINENKEIRKQIRQQEEKIRSEKRQQEREEYVQKQVNKHINNTSKKKHSNNSDDFCRVKSSPFYEPQTSKTNKTSEVSSKKSRKNKPPIQNNGLDEDTVSLVFGNGSKKTKTEKAEDLSENIAETKTDISNISSEQPPFEYITEESDIFADNTEFINSVAEDKSQIIPTNFTDGNPVNIDKPTENRKTLKDKIKNIQIDDIKGEYIRPPVILLEPQPEDDNHNISMELHQNGTMLVETLKSFGVQTTIVNISRGPSVTRYELQPAAGVKISKITNLADDIAMNLAATGVRIEAPIPGKSAVGIEVPNKNVSIVKMRNLIESSEFINAKSKLTVALGYDITGKITLADLGRMPHLLIAGSTGSGKSVCINSMLVSLLYKSTPDEVKLMLIDPKVVELGVYNGIPNLLVPVVTDPRKAAGALNWAVNEMLERYKTFAEYNVRDMHSYNRLVDRQNSEFEESEIHHDDTERSFEEDEMLAQAQSEVDVKNPKDEPHKLKKMPQIVIVIDELADLMMAAPNEVEESICRLAQMARAAGMHLVIATQRPSVDVITGLIKANVPSRIAFAVKSQIDSRTILDSGGAEKLLGRGDMLFSPIGTTKPIRVQGCYVDDTEIESIIEFIKNSKVVEYDNNVMEEIEKNAVIESAKTSSDTDNLASDPMMEQAIKCVVEAGQASTSLLQRRLRLGYARAGRLIDEMEQMGIVGPHEGSKPRQVLMSYQQWLERNTIHSDSNN